jgi:hypothetical protein
MTHSRKRKTTANAIYLRLLLRKNSIRPKSPRRPTTDTNSTNRKMNTNHLKNRGALIALSLGLAILPAANTQAAIVSYYVGVDGNTGNITSGTYAGLPQPNGGRLTFLYSHGDHYHSKGVFRYTGPNLGAGTATEVNPNNFLPEGTNPPLVLSVASGGIYDGKLVSASIPGNDFSFLTIEDTRKLSGFGPTDPETILFNSSSGRWNGSLSGADVHLELVFLTPGLNVGDSSTLNLFTDPGDDLHLEDSFSFTPTFWTDATAANGVYIAQFKLTDEADLFGDSGTFEFRFQVIPEPSTALLSALGAIALLRRRR